MDLTVDTLKSKVTDLETDKKDSENNRVSLLSVHSIIGIGVGLAILWEGGPNSFASFLSPESKDVLLGVVPLAGGVLLGAGICLRRNLALESLGMNMLLIWDLWMFYGFVKVAMEPHSTVYPLVVYAGFAAFMVIHLRTLYRFMSRGKRNGSD